MRLSVTCCLDNKLQIVNSSNILIERRTGVCVGGGGGRGGVCVCVGVGGGGCVCGCGCVGVCACGCMCGWVWGGGACNLCLSVLESANF